MRLVVIDTETTGLTETDQICELAVVAVQEETATTWSSLIRPSCPVSPGARATHHISDEELKGAPSLQELLDGRGLPELENEDIVLAAHNAEFDIRMLRQSGVPEDFLAHQTICSYRCALHLFPDAPKHSNQVLRYHLGLDTPNLSDNLPHRALPDAVVTTGLIQRMLEMRSISQLIELTTAPVLLETIRFGKYRGQPWAQLDHGYLNWIMSKDFDTDAKFTAQHWINKRRGT